MKELDVLYETVIDRKANGEEGSYTSYLFNKGLDKILKKWEKSVQRLSLPPYHKVKKSL